VNLPGVVLSWDENTHPVRKFLFPSTPVLKLRKRLISISHYLKGIFTEFCVEVSIKRKNMRNDKIEENC